jgi:hypothetical protein
MFMENIIAKYGIRKTLSFGTNNFKLKKKKTLKSQTFTVKYTYKEMKLHHQVYHIRYMVGQYIFKWIIMQAFEKEKYHPFMTRREPREFFKFIN